MIELQPLQYATGTFRVAPLTLSAYRFRPDGTAAEYALTAPNKERFFVGADVSGNPIQEQVDGVQAEWARKVGSLLEELAPSAEVRTGTPVIRHFPDLWYTVRAWPEEHTVHFEIFEILGLDENGDRHMYDCKVVGQHETSDLDLAEVAVAGHVKWDGCSNWWASHAYHHQCRRVQLTNYGEAMARCWDLAKELGVNWHGQD